MINRLHRIRLMFALLLIGFAASLARGEALSPVQQRLQADVQILASDEYEGRGVGTDGLNKAAAYMSEAFRDAGLTVTVAGGDPYQEFEVIDGARLNGPNTLALHGPDGQTIELERDEDFRVCSFGESGRFSAPLVFCGYGIESEDPAYNDFAGVDVAGKVVILMRRTPQQGNEFGLFSSGGGHGMSRHAAVTTKVSNAFQHKAAAVLFVNDPYTGRSEAEQLREQLAKAMSPVADLAGQQLRLPQEEDAQELRTQLKEALDHLHQVQDMVAQDDADPLMEFGYGGTRGGKSLPILHISQASLNKILEPSLKMTLEQIEARIDAAGRPMSQVLEGWTAAGQTSLEQVKVPVKNVIGVLEGAGPLADETIVIGAHYDHVGLGGEGSLAPGSKEVHNGADDNASGAAVLIELARRLAARERPLPRRVVFLAFTGEERGLLGSAHYVKEPIFPLDTTVAMLNMDMVGRLEEDKLTVFGTGTSQVWNDLIDDLAAEQGLEIFKKPEGFGPSDHSSFYAKQIPVLHLFTGTHSDYHRPSDDWQKLNVEGMERIANVMEAAVVAVAVASARPDYVAVKGQAQLTRSGSRPYFGSIPDFGTNDQGYAISGVSPDSPAAKGGLKAGDVIIKFGDHAIGSLDDFDLALRKFSAGEEVNVVVLREGRQVPLKITLAKPRS